MMSRAAKIALLKVVMLLVIVLTFLAATNFLVSMQIESTEEDLAKMNAQVMQVKSKLAEIKTEQKVREEAKKFYESYEISDSSEPENFTRERARANIASMRKQFGLNSIQLYNSGFREVKHPLATENSVALASYATIRFSAAYDVPMFDFIAAIEDTLPGIISVADITLKKTGQGNEQDIERITKGEEVNLVTAEISFHWFGVVDPTLVPSEPVLSEIDHADNLKNIFDAMNEMAEGLDKTILDEKAQAEKAEAEKAPAAKLVPITGVQPAKQLDGTSDPKNPETKPVSPAAKTPAPAEATTKQGKKLQTLQPTNIIPQAPPAQDTEGGGNEN